MGLRDNIRNLVSTAMKAVGDIAEKGIYDRVTPGVYDPATSTHVETVVSYEDVTIVLTSFAMEEIDNDVDVRTDQKALIAANDLPVVPAKPDRIRLPIRNAFGAVIGTAVWNVQRILGVPGDSLFKIHIRKA